jgi:hypothetical protein
VSRVAAAGYFHIFAEIDGPCVVGVAGEEATGAEFETARPDVAVMATVVPGVCVRAHDG